MTRCVEEKKEAARGRFKATEAHSLERRGEMAKLKYKNLQEVKAAFDSGELDRKSVFILLDNDSCTIYRGDVLVEEALDLLGIPWENA